MAVLAKLRKRLGIKPPHFRERQKLEDATGIGRLAPYCGPQRYFAEVEKVLGWSGDDFIELDMAIEEYGKPVWTVGDLLQMWEELDSEYQIEDP
jgi:hypothetical protein